MRQTQRTKLKNYKRTNIPENFFLDMAFNILNEPEICRKILTSVLFVITYRKTKNRNTL